MNLKILATVFCLLLCIRGLGAWWWSKKRSKSQRHVPVKSEESPVLDDSEPYFDLSFNCTKSSITETSSKLTVAKLHNHTEIICELIADTSRLSKASRNDENATDFCNNLGDDVCPTCTNDSTYSTVIENISISCSIEQIATTEAMTAVTMATGEAVPNNTIDSHTSSESSGPSGKSDGNSKSGENLKIIMIIVGACVVLLLAIGASILIHKSKKLKKKAAVNQKNEDDQVVRVEANATGELYTVINKNFQGSGEMVDNVLYVAHMEDPTNENQDIYSNVENKKIGNNSGDLYTEVDKSKKTEQR